MKELSNYDPKTALEVYRHIWLETLKEGFDLDDRSALGSHILESVLVFQTAIDDLECVNSKLAAASEVKV